MKKKERNSLHLDFHHRPFQAIILGFAGVILLGTLLLMLPVSSATHRSTSLHDSLFTAVSAVCVTGLVVKDTGSYWSQFGQTVILLLIQIGGLGVITVAAVFAMLSGRKIGLMQRSTMQSSISAFRVGGIVRLTRFIVKGTFLIEGIGAFFRYLREDVASKESGWRYSIPFPLSAMPVLICLALIQDVLYR